MLENAINIPREYTALAQFISIFLYVFILGTRLSKVRIFAYSLFFVIVQIFMLVITSRLGGFLWILIMFLSFVSMYLYFSSLISKDIKTNIYFVLKAFLLSEFMASFNWQLIYYLKHLGMQFYFLNLFITIMIYLLISVLIYFIEKNLVGDKNILISTKKELLPIFVIVIGAFVLSNLSFIFSNTPFTSSIDKEIFNIRTLVDLGGLAILFAYQIRMIEVNKENELVLINSILQAQYDKFRNYQENLAMINIKYHDLKHQISALKRELDVEKRNLWIKNLEEELEEYKPKILTGNSVLDTIIDSKNMIIKKASIKFTVVADGSLLEKIHVTDICSIFGNAIDNAIEAVNMVEEVDKRLIHLSLSKKKDFIFIELINSLDSMPRIIEGEIKTSKSDKRNHGFGIKSMEYVVKKYNGNLDYKVKDKNFILRIMIPYEKSKTIV